MKNKITFLFAALAVALFLTAATAPTGWVQGPTHLWRYQSDQTWDASTSTVTASPVTAFFSYDLANGSQVVTNQVGSVSFDPVAIGKDQTVTVGSVTVDYGTLAALNAKAALDQWNKQQAEAEAPKATPQPTKPSLTSSFDSSIMLFRPSITFAGNGKPSLVIHPDGKIECDDPSEGAKAFVAALHKELAETFAVAP
jgi:hypothetical protein